MDMIFLGTRANTDAQSSLYKNKSLCVVMSKKAVVWIDCAHTWLNTLHDIPYRPDAICISHAHNDHVGGLRNGSPAPVYASKETWSIIDTYPIDSSHRNVVEYQKKIPLKDITITPYNVLHSVHAPVNGYKISNGSCTMFYAADVAEIVNIDEALDNVDIYIGDGSIVERTMLLRENNDQATGHAPITHQLRWCYDYNIQHAIFTHCGAAIIKKDFEAAQRWIQDLAHEYNVNAILAYDNYTTSCDNIMS